MLARRRALRATVVASIFGGTAALGLAAACGIDLEGTLPEVIPVVDAGVDVRPMTPPRADGSPPPVDAEVDASRSCPSGLPGPVMVGLPGADYCIDSTEVTNAQYDLLLTATDGGGVEAGIPDGGLPAMCAGQRTFARKNGDVDGGPAALPVARVKWCDAYAFCAFAGKRLCGKRAGDGDASTGEWYRACSVDGTRAWPYGGAYVLGVCNDNNGGLRDPVRSNVSCEGGVPGLWDMSGNVDEYIDGCDAGVCPALGGSIPSGEDLVRCDSQVWIDQTLPPTDSTGFRCCADKR